jgi:hypothetical protein
LNLRILSFMINTLILYLNNSIICRKLISSILFNILLGLCIYFFFCKRRSIKRITPRMKYRNLTCWLSLNKWVQSSSFNFRWNKCLAKIKAIFVKVYNTSILVNQHAYYWTFLEETILRLFINMNMIVISPFSIIVFISSL